MALIRYRCSLRHLFFFAWICIALYLVTSVIQRTLIQDKRYEAYKIFKRNLHSTGFSRIGKKSLKSGCVLPYLDIKDPVMMKFYKKKEPINCREHHHDLVYVNNGTLRFSKPLSRDTKCYMYPLIRGPGDYRTSYGPPVEIVKHNASLLSDFLKVQCTRNDTTIYENIHLGVHSNTTLKNQIRQIKLPADGLQLSVLMLGFDSMSRMSWLRRMPKTQDYLVNQLGATDMEGYSIMGDGTPAALFPILTGKHEQELPEARRSHSDAKPVDDFPWVWRDFKRHGYVTSFAESSPGIATFNYRLLGFDHSPTDFYTRPFYLAAEKIYRHYYHGCHGSLRHHEIWFNFIKNIFEMYKNDPKFLFQFYDSLSHNSNNGITMADDDLYQLLYFLQSGGYLDDTLLVVFADHGPRFSNVRSTFSGKIEERTPYLALKFPKWFHIKHPDLIKNVKTNRNRLTTPMDIHETLKDILHFQGSGIGNLKHRGISLFKEIPIERTCTAADIAPHWCACMSWKKLSNNDETVQNAVKTAVGFINSLTKSYREFCSTLSLKSITHAYRAEVTDSLIRFKETTGDRGLEPILGYNTAVEKFLYQVTFFTDPGEGEFEITTEYNKVKDEFLMDTKAISRTNMYGHDSDCVSHKTRDLRQFCYCKKKTSSNT